MPRQLNNRSIADDAITSDKIANGAIDATDIADASITAAKLADTYLTPTGDGSQLTGINTDLVSDTTPQLGGNLDTNGKNINVGDSSVWSQNRVTFGWSSDLQIYHDGNNSFIGDYGGTGSLFIQTGDQLYIQADHGENYVICNKDGTVELFHDNSEKLRTTSTGVTVTGTIGVTTVDLGNWTITESGGVLYFATGGTNKMKLDASGNLTVVGEVTAYGTV